MPEHWNDPDTPTGITFRHATTPDDLAACYDVIAALRPVLRSAEDWIERALRQMERIARDTECEKLVRDTAVSNTDAQRFYRRAGFENIALGLMKSLGK
ncbi:GNAT family N-acetyltransferase [Acetobacter sp.]|uniref:GNAT family N-acetyltransferase n=1 Tax=Acetobacter sp. TaxID=440 RepID=UPI0039E99BA6